MFRLKIQPHEAALTPFRQLSRHSCMSHRAALGRATHWHLEGRLLQRICSAGGLQRNGNASREKLCLGRIRNTGEAQPVSTGTRHHVIVTTHGLKHPCAPHLDCLLPGQKSDFEVICLRLNLTFVVVVEESGGFKQTWPLVQSKFIRYPKPCRNLS